MNDIKRPLRVAIYARQSVEESEGIAQQVAACRAYIERHDDWIVVDVYPDNATSASKERGPKSEWARLLRDADAGVIDAVVVVSVDRLMRRFIDVVEVRPPRRDLRVIAARQGFDTAESSGSFFLGMMVLLAEQEINEKQLRTGPYVGARRAAGHPWPGRVPYGYRWIPAIQREGGKEGPRWRVDLEEAAVVRRVFREFLAGPDIKLGAIARDLNDDKIRTRPPKPKEGQEPREGARWGTPTLRRMLLSPFYAGLLPKVQGWADFDAARVVIEECTTGAWEPIIPEEMYLAARARLLDDGRRKHNGNARRWLLSGLASCDRCGILVRSARTREGFHGYRCPDGHFLRKGDIIDQYVEHVVIERLSADDALDLLTPSETGQDLPVLMAHRAVLEGRDAALAGMVAKGTLRAGAAEQALEELADELRTVNAAIAVAATADPLADIATADDVRAVWDGLSLERRRAIVDALCIVRVPPIGKGRTATTLEEAASTVAIIWRRPGRRNYPVPTLVNEAEAVAAGFLPDLSIQARAVLSTALHDAS